MGAKIGKITGMETPDSLDRLSSSTASTVEQTRSHLRLLGIFYILFGLLALPVLALFGFHDMILDQALANTHDPEMREAIERIANMIGFAVVFFVLLHVIVGFYIGRCFRKQRRYTLCMISAVLACLSFPIGTILGVFSIIVLTNPEAKYLFEKG